MQHRPYQKHKQRSSFTMATESCKFHTSKFEPRGLPKRDPSAGRRGHACAMAVARFQRCSRAARKYHVRCSSNGLHADALLGSRDRFDRLFLPMCWEGRTSLCTTSFFLLASFGEALSCVSRVMCRPSTSRPGPSNKTPQSLKRDCAINRQSSIPKAATDLQ